MTHLTVAGATLLMALAVEPWYPINDDVMGGVSSGRMFDINEGLRFSGTLSLENNGGFASVRRVVGEALSETGGIRLKVRGDGRRYQLRLHQRGSFEGVSWTTSFDTERTWRTVELKYSDFKASYRGRFVPSAGGLEADRITHIGFLIGDKTHGEFQLDIGHIEFLTT